MSTCPKTQKTIPDPECNLSFLVMLRSLVLAAAVFAVLSANNCRTNFNNTNIQQHEQHHWVPPVLGLSIKVGSGTGGKVGTRQPSFFFFCKMITHFVSVRRVCCCCCCCYYCCYCCCHCYCCCLCHHCCCCHCCYYCCCVLCGTCVDTHKVEVWSSLVPISDCGATFGFKKNPPCPIPSGALPLPFICPPICTLPILFNCP